MTAAASPSTRLLRQLAKYLRTCSHYAPLQAVGEHQRPNRVVVIAGASLFHAASELPAGVGFVGQVPARVYVSTCLTAVSINGYLTATLGLTALEGAGLGEAVEEQIGYRGRWTALVVQALCEVVDSIDEGSVRQRVERPTDAELTPNDWLQAVVMTTTD